MEKNKQPEPTHDKQAGETVEGYPHLVRLSQYVQRADAIDREVDLFLSQKDASFDNKEQAFRCGAYFGARKESERSYSREEVEDILEEVLERASLRSKMTFHDGRTKENRPIVFYQSGVDHINPDKANILSTPFKDLLTK